MKAKMAQNVRPVDAGRDHILGAPGAEISIIEYSDFECPYCKRFHETPQSLVRKLGAGVNLVFRHFPLDFHDPMATREALGATCAGLLGGNPQFWAFANAVMARTETNGKGIPAKGKTDPLVALATSLKLDTRKFLACVKSEEAMRKVKEDIADGIKSGINGTPGVILRNNRTGRVISLAGAVPEPILEERIRELSR
jgi:protein-disulfide isomerase